MTPLRTIVIYQEEEGMDSHNYAEKVTSRSNEFQSGFFSKTMREEVYAGREERVGTL